MPKCKNCGRDVKPEDSYCEYCGASVPPSSVPFTSAPDGKKKKAKSGSGNNKLIYHLIAYFIVVTIVNSILTFIVTSGFALPAHLLLGTFFSFYFLCMIVIGIIWLAVYFGGAEGAEAMGYVCGVVIAIAIAVPFYLITVFSTVASEIGSRITQAVNDALSEAFEDVEVPGFEPFLLISVFALASIIVIYRYHLMTRKK